MKNELILSVETSDDEWFEIFSYEETETDLKNISELIIFKTNTDCKMVEWKNESFSKNLQKMWDKFPQFHDNFY